MTLLGRWPRAIRRGSCLAVCVIIIHLLVTQPLGAEDVSPLSLSTPVFLHSRYLKASYIIILLCAHDDSLCVPRSEEPKLFGLGHRSSRPTARREEMTAAALSSRGVHVRCYSMPLFFFFFFSYR